jgi:hypothetical protein
MIVSRKHIFSVGMAKVRRDRGRRGVYVRIILIFCVQKENGDKIFLFLLGNLPCRGLENRLSLLLPPFPNARRFGQFNLKF